MSNSKFVQTPIMSLVAGIGISDTSITVTPFPKDLEGVKLTMTDFGTAPTGTIDPKISGIEEIISFTGITDNGDNTATLTGVTRNLSSKSPYTTLGSGRQHGANAIFVISDNPQLFARMAALDADNTFTGNNTFDEAVTIPETPTADTDAASKGYVDTGLAAKLDDSQLDTTPTLGTDDTKIPSQNAVKEYVDNTAIAGAPDASTTVKGIVEIATQAQVDAGTDTGETGAKLAVTPDLLNGKFGDGSDGDVVISTPTTLTRDMYYNNLTVTSTLYSNGFRIFVKGTISGAGTISCTGASSYATSRFKNGLGYPTGGDYNYGVSGTVGGSYSGAGGNGGGNYNPGSGGAVPTRLNKFGTSMFASMMGVDLLANGTFTSIIGGGGGGGGGGGLGSGTGNGKGGNGGGVVLIIARIFAGSFTIDVRGENGNNGNAGADGNGYYRGGGGGGGGGAIFVIYSTKTWTGSSVVTGGTAGTNGGANAAVNGGNGTYNEIAIKDINY